MSELAFVAGATGLTGRFVVRALRARGVDTIAHVRPSSPSLASWRARFEGEGAEVDATEWEPHAIRETLAARRAALLFALLGTTRARERRVAAAGGDASAETYEKVDVGMTLMLLEGALAISPPPRFVYLSSIGAGEGARGAYLEARTRVEARVRASGVPYTIARPSFIVGDRDDARPLERLATPIADASLALLGALGARATRDRYRSITGEALGEALVRLALDPGAARRVVERGELG